MQTKQKIQQLLASAGTGPNKRLGQNFLIDLNLMRLLLDSANIGKDDIVLEVGCGTGSLTEELAKRAGICIVAELDTTLAKIAMEQLAGNQNMTIVNADILQNKNQISGEFISMIQKARGEMNGKFLLVANLPYSVACPVIANLITGPVTADAMFVTIQKEVAMRLMAGPGENHYGSLSVLVGATGKIDLIRVLKPSVFWPQPEVDSAIVSFTRDRGKIEKIKDLTILRECIDLFMQHRRKQLKACLRLAKGSLGEINNWDEIFEKSSIDPHGRPDGVSPDQFVTMANLCSEASGL